MSQGILFISTMGGDPWGGSEELWTRAAKILARDGFDVKASVQSRTPLHPRFLDLAKSGVNLHPHPSRVPASVAISRRLQKLPQQWGGLQHVRRLLARTSPGLVVLSEARNFPPVDLIELLASSYNFVTISHNNSELWWPVDGIASRLRRSIALAKRCYFVSEGNRRLVEMQLGADLPNASIIRNPCAVDFDTPFIWPNISADEEIIFACVGRLDPNAKGQDLLIEALAKPQWAQRKWKLKFFGDGPMRETLTRLVDRRGLADRVSFAGHVANVHDVWANSHVLLQPSRHEGLPLSLVEAMFCGRPVIATDVAGHAEVIADGITGFLARSATVADVADALERAWANRNDLSKMGQAAAQRIRSIMPRNPEEKLAEELRGLLSDRNR